MNNNFFSVDVLYGDNLFQHTQRQLIPSLQRQYTWDKKSVNKLWGDIIENNSPYFVGTIVLISGEGSSSRDEVIDGQQRLTTISLILIALRDLIKEKYGEEHPYLGEIRKLLLVPQFIGDPSPTLEFFDKSSNDVYKTILFGRGEFSKPKIKSQTNRFFDNYFEIRKLIEKTVGEGVEVSDIFNKIKSLEMVITKCATYSLGYKLFEGLNATAVQLVSTDLIKNSLFMKLREDSILLEEAQNKWIELESKFEGSRFLRDFVRHQWLSTIGYVNQSNLFEAFQKIYIKNSDKNNTYRYIETLLDDADLYLALRNARIDNLNNLPCIRNDRKEIRALLEFINFLNIDQIYPVIMYIYKNKPDNFKKYLVRLASFQFLFKYLPGSPSIVEKIYAQFCKGGMDINGLSNELKKLCSDRQEFIESFLDKIKYKEGKSGDVQFILQKLINNKQPEIEYINPTIEHIIPREPEGEYKKLLESQFKKYKTLKYELDKIGNLTILDKKSNGSIENTPFVDKKGMYESSGFVVNQEINRYDFENDPQDAIKKRGRDISTEIYDIFLSALNSGKF